MTRRSAQRRKAERTSSGRSDPTMTGSMPNVRNEAVSAAARASCSRLRSAASFRAEVHGNDAAGLGICERHRHPADVGKGSLPHRILDDHRNELPALLARALPLVHVRRNEEVREDEDERLSGELAPVAAEVLEAERDRVGRCVERAVVGAGVGEALAPRRLPVDLALRMVDVPGKTPRGLGAHADQVDRVQQRLRLVERTERRRADSHRRPPVGEYDHPRRLVREVLVDDELVAVARRRDARRGRPVDPAHMVSGPVLARACDVEADAAAGTADTAERESDHAPSRDEREDADGHGLPGFARRRSGHTAADAGTSRSMSNPGFGAS